MTNGNEYRGEDISVAVRNFEKKVADTLERYGMIQKDDTVLAALSGGADSVSLTLTLHSLCKDLGFSLAACHLNHGIRKESAERDETFSRKLCERLEIPFYSEKADIPAVCKERGGSIETVAREERYAFFERAAAHFGASKIATAHTMSDNAETVIFNLSRGSSVDGMCGIPPVRDRFIRPLITSSRAEVEKYLSLLGQTYVMDETNADDELSRNFIRHSVIPRLKELNGELEKAILRLSDSARLDREYFDEKTDCLLSQEMSTSSMALLPDALFYRCIREKCKKSAGDKTMISADRLRAVGEAVRKTACDGKKREISLPSQLCAVIDKNGLHIEKSNGSCDIATSSFNIPLSFGKNIINEVFAIFISQSGKSGELPDVIENEDNVYKLYKKAECVSAIMDNDLFVRERRAGDRIRLGGMRRNLKKVFSESCVDIRERRMVPVVCNNDDVICVPFFSAPCDNAKPNCCDKSITIAFYKAQ